jgi:hypothetical protein
MAYMYCNKCHSEIADWREAYKGCHECGEQHIIIEEAFDKLQEEVADLESELSAIKREIRQLKETH